MYVRSEKMRLIKATIKPSLTRRQMIQSCSITSSINKYSSSNGDERNIVTKIDILILYIYVLVYTIYIYNYICLFHPRYLHNDIFRYMTCEITHDISRHFKVVFSPCTEQAQYPGYLPLCVEYSTGLEHLLKYQLGCVGSPYNQLYAVSTSSLVLTTAVKISSVE